VKNFKSLLLVGCGALALSSCGPSDIASPGNGGNVTITNTTTPPPVVAPTPVSTLVTPATGCPTIADGSLTDAGTITGPTGTWRVCSLPALINKSITLPKLAGLLYRMDGRVDVGIDRGFTRNAAVETATAVATLTIQPGVIIYGNSGTSWLAVNRGNKINAVGTATQPIIFTSRDNVLGLNIETSQGQWGGVVLLGRARITGPCTQGGSVALDTCERKTEGSADPATYGGTNDADNSGTMSYVQIRYSGYVLGADSELQALTPSGIGSGTVLNNIMSYNSSDDGAEFFGGVVNMKNYVAVGADDDSLDVDNGATANFQNLLLIQRSAKGDALLEIDSNGAESDTPRTTLKITNMTALQPALSSDNEANDQAAMLFRGNSDTTLANSIIVTPNNECLRLNGSGTTPATFTARSVVMQCNATKYIGTGSGAAAFTAASVATAFGSGANNNNDAFTNTLASQFINGTNENAVTSFNVTTLSTFFSAVTSIGAVKNAADNWYASWTCNSEAANFGTGNTGLCTTIPTN